MKRKVNKNEFLEVVAGNSDMDVTDVRKVYDAIIDELRNVICSGRDLSLTGFGTFSLKRHRGHPVQFGAAADQVGDYVVLKFTVSDVLMSKIRAMYVKQGALPVSR